METKVINQLMTKEEALEEYLNDNSGYRDMTNEEYIMDQSFYGLNASDALGIAREAFMEGVWWGARVSNNA